MDEIDLTKVFFLKLAIILSIISQFKNLISSFFFIFFLFFFIFKGFFEKLSAIFNLLLANL